MDTIATAERARENDRTSRVHRLPDGRAIGFAEYGDPDGLPVMALHGTPGARLQIAPEARLLAHERSIRIVSVERPGVGESTPHVFESVVDFALDIEQLAEWARALHPILGCNSRRVSES